MSIPLSVVIPLGPKEQFPSKLVEQLKYPFAEIEIVIGAGEHPGAWATGDVKWVNSPWGRARQLNAAGAVAKGRWVWFLHADSKLPTETIDRVAEIVKEGKRGFYFFRLAFERSADSRLQLNAYGANLRSRFLKMPFGDQGFLLPGDLWRAIGPYSETVAYGEDHLFAWALRNAGVPFFWQPETILTSPRKYQSQGWGTTTRQHVVLTWKQAVPEWRKSLRRSALSRGTGVAVFVKSPSLSPVKTRLGQSTSGQTAREFYGFSLDAIEGLAEGLSQKGDTAVYWAVAEKEGLELPRWQNLPRLWQGDGSLGDRLYTIYEQLLEKHGRAFLIGADCPHLTSREIEIASRSLDTHSFVVGLAADGGFYLFGGKRPLPRAFWLTIPYSESTTGERLREKLATVGTLFDLPVKTDVDAAPDLAALIAEVSRMPAADFHPRQRTALDKIEDLEKKL